MTLLATRPDVNLLKRQPYELSSCTKLPGSQIRTSFSERADHYAVVNAQWL